LAAGPSDSAAYAQAPLSYAVNSGFKDTADHGGGATRIPRDWQGNGVFHDAYIANPKLAQKNGFTPDVLAVIFGLICECYTAFCSFMNKKCVAHKMKIFSIIACIGLVACGAFAADDIKGKPTLKVAADGLPEGHETPEGAACDLARAFIKRDDALFTKTCIRLYAGGKGPEDYAKFLQSTVESMKAEAAKAEPSPGGPKSIGKVFAARHLSKNGPASFGYAAFGFLDIMFVDVGVLLQNGERRLNRTLVIKDKDGKWYVDPLPTAGSGLLGDGLGEEPASKKDSSEAYEIRK
jgi:hypothetical protein